MKFLKKALYCLFIVLTGQNALAQDVLYKNVMDLSYYVISGSGCQLGPATASVTLKYSGGTYYQPTLPNTASGASAFYYSETVYSLVVPTIFEFSLFGSGVDEGTSLTAAAYNGSGVSDKTQQAASSCAEGPMRLTSTRFSSLITNANGSVFAYCDNASATVNLPVGATNVRWKIWNAGNTGNKQPIGGNSRTLTFNAAMVRALGLNPAAQLTVYADADYGTVTNRKSNELTGFIFLPQPARPMSIQPQAADCYGQSAKLILSNFQNADNTAYTGSEALDITIRGNNSPFTRNVEVTSNIPYLVDVAGNETYTVTVERKIKTVACPYVTTSPFVPKVPDAITATFTKECSAGAPAVRINATGGNGGFKYGIVSDPTSTSPLVTGLAGGTAYTFYVKDSKGCTYNNEPQYNMNAALVVTVATKDDPTSPGASDGRIIVTGTGGSGGLQYSIDNTNWGGSTFTGLTQGTYTIRVKDNLGCISSVTTTLTDPAPVVVTATVTNISCNGLSDGRIVAGATGGIPPFTYSSDNNTFLTINTFDDLPAGSHRIWAKDSKGNNSYQDFTINMPPLLTIAVSSQKNAICKGVAGGEIVVTGAGGTGAYQYQINTDPYQPAATFTVGAGNYTVRVSDARNCKATTAPVNITEPAQGVTFSTALSSVSCNGGENGVITVTPLTGVAPFKYATDLVNWQPETVLSGLTAGTYTVNVEDANGCRSNTTGLIITEPTPLDLQLISVTQPLCNGNANGRIDVAASGGVGNIYYTISSAASIHNTSGIFTDLLAGDYIIKAIDDNNCETPLPVTVGQPAVLVLQPTTTHVTCFGNSNGSVALAGTGGTPDYFYSADNISFSKTTTTFNNLVAGNYTYYLKDNNNCTAQAAVTVTQPAALTFSTVVTNTLCNGAATGTVAVTAAGGTPAYSYNADAAPFQNDVLLTGLAEGVHSISVMDNNGCTTTNNGVYVGQPTALSLTVTNNQPASCYGGSNGSVTVQAAGGTGAYSYALDHGTYRAAATFTGLAAGTYVMTVKDANDCTLDINVTVGQSAQLTLQTTGKTDIICAGEATGNMTLQATGGAGNYQYSLDGAAFQTLGYYDHLVAKAYNVTVMDDYTCTRNFTVTLTDLHAPVTATLSAVPPPTCEDRGTITVTNVTGGVSPYSYSLDNATYVTDPLFTNLYNGDYTVYVKDDLGCTITRSISPYGPVSLHGTVIPTAVSCKNGINGRLTVNNVTGGNNNYEYSIGGNVYQPSNIFNGLAAGTYLVYVRDIPYSCQTVISATITEPSLLQLTEINNKSVSCYGLSNGETLLQVSGGSGNNTFTIDGGNANTTGSFDQLAAGTYLIAVTDANACIATQSVTITQPEVLTADVASLKDISCFGDGDGQITLAATGGTLPYSFTNDANTYQNNELFSNLDKGDYTFEVKDRNNCLYTVNASIAEPSALVLSVTGTTDILCYSASTGDITLAATGGTGQYAYALNNLAAQSSPVFNYLTAGDYLMAVTDENSCVTRQPVILTQPDRLRIDKQVKQATCSYINDGSVMLTVNGGVTPYNYNWSNGGTADQITDLGAGVYEVTVTDQNGCIANDNAALIQPGELKINLGFTDTTLCVGQVINLSAGNPGATYSWKSDAGFNDDKQISAISKDGRYDLTVTTVSGCVATESFNVKTSLTALTADFLLSSYALAGDTVMVIDISRPKPANNEWTMPEGAREVGVAGDGTIHQVIFDAPGDYTIQMKAVLGQCADAMTRTISIKPASQREETDSLLGYRPGLIQQVAAYPNPTDGIFKVKVKLSAIADIQLRVISFNTGNVEEVKKGAGNSDYEIQFTNQQLVQGIYLIALQVGTEYKVIRILKM